MTTFLKKQYSEGNILFYLIILLCLFAIFPFIYLIQYNIPGASDDMAHGFLFIDKSYFDGIYTWYTKGYNGRFANAFFMQLPGRPFLNTGFGKVFPFFTFTCFFASIFYLLNSINGKINWKNNLFFSLLIFTYFLAFTPSVQQFYWYSGTTVYILPAIFYFVLLSLLIKNFNKKFSAFKLIIATLLLFFIIGSHENWMIIGLITVFFFIANSLLSKEKIIFSSYFILIWAIILASFVLFAPGTTHRMSGEGGVSGNADLWGSLCHSVLYSGSYIKDWFLNIGFVISFIGLIFLPQSKTVKSDTLKEYSNILLLIIAFAFIFISFFILLYSLGLHVKLRLRGILPGFFTSSIIIFYLARRLSMNSRISSLTDKISKNANYIIIITGLVLGISSSPNINNAYTDIFSGNAKEASQQILWLQNFINKSKEKELRIPQLNLKTKTLYLLSIPYPEDGWNSWTINTYFHKKIILDTNITFEEFLFINDPLNSTKEVQLSPNRQYSPGFKISLDSIMESQKQSVLVRAKIKNFASITANTKCMLVFDCKPYWKGFYLKDLIKESDFINFQLKIPDIENPPTRVLKVYFYNPGNDTVIISKMDVKLL